ncbi:hypothetical protein PRZ48_002106 [Zasmidium cellare]|uniref:Uncharacterized protein n=1 Tax=Zasmidium cellare TaxID=395010 RepID=A0ABR0F4G3_ZASCE|nr:hypothetical protein PRZ48_002106 [Zasmidium cellare]
MDPGTGASPARWGMVGDNAPSADTASISPTLRRGRGMFSSPSKMSPLKRLSTLVFRRSVRPELNGVYGFRCDIFGNGAADTAAAEAECKQLVAEAGGKVLQVTYPGGFLYTIPLEHKVNPLEDGDKTKMGGHINIYPIEWENRFGRVCWNALRMHPVNVPPMPPVYTPQRRPWQLSPTPRPRRLRWEEDDDPHPHDLVRVGDSIQQLANDVDRFLVRVGDGIEQLVNDVDELLKDVVEHGIEAPDQEPEQEPVASGSRRPRTFYHASATGWSPSGSLGSVAEENDVFGSPSSRYDDSVWTDTAETVSIVHGARSVYIPPRSAPGSAYSVWTDTNDAGSMAELEGGFPHQVEDEFAVYSASSSVYSTNTDRVREGDMYQREDDEYEYQQDDQYQEDEEYEYQQGEEYQQHAEYQEEDDDEYQQDVEYQHEDDVSKKEPSISSSQWSYSTGENFNVVPNRDAPVMGLPERTSSLPNMVYNREVKALPKAGGKAKVVEEVEVEAQPEADAQPVVGADTQTDINKTPKPKKSGFFKKLNPLKKKEDDKAKKAPTAKAPSTKAPNAKAPSTKAPNTKAPKTKAPSSVSSRSTGQQTTATMMFM